MAFENKPLHVQFREALLARIAAGEWRPGASLPNEIELAQSYGLSVGTVRKALSWMEDVDVIARQQGRGTFVQPRADVGQRYIGLRDGSGAPIVCDVRAGIVTYGQADAVECERLGLRAGAEVRRTRRILKRHGRPVCTELSVVPSRLAPFKGSERHSDLTLLDLCKTFNLFLGEGEERLFSAVADADVASVLDCQQGTPVFRFDRLIHTLQGDALEWSTGYWLVEGGYYLSMIGIRKPGSAKRD